MLTSAAGLTAATAPSAILSGPAAADTATAANAHIVAAEAAKKLAAGRTVKLTILEPSGSLGNVKPVADKWTADTGIAVDFVEVPLGEINQKVLLEAVSRSDSFDLALPATFGIPDLAESGILVNLDKYAEVHEPADFQKDVLYTIGDYYKGSLDGYETDGDTYLMFYNKPWLDNAKNNA